jgi:NAD-dependent SIR2 family protein deacetylase
MLLAGQFGASQFTIPGSCIRHRILQEKSSPMYALPCRRVHACSDIDVVYTLAKELYPGKYRPTPTHSFIKLLSDKGLLGLCFTQNIDTLERRAGIPAGKIIEAHGSFATQRCVECKRSFNDSEMKEFVEEERIPRCKSCKGLVKPDIVFFGESVGVLAKNI